MQKFCGIEEKILCPDDKWAAGTSRGPGTSAFSSGPRAKNSYQEPRFCLILWIFYILPCHNRTFERRTAGPSCSPPPEAYRGATISSRFRAPDQSRRDRRFHLQQMLPYCCQRYPGGRSASSRTASQVRSVPGEGAQEICEKFRWGRRADRAGAGEADLGVLAIGRAGPADWRARLVTR